MRHHLAFALTLVLAAGQEAAASTPHKPQNGDALLKMCRGAEKVRALGVMCHSYLSGYLDTASLYGKVKFCVKDSDKELIPPLLVAWLNAHPEALAKPAPEVINLTLTANFPCR